MTLHTILLRYCKDNWVVLEISIILKQFWATPCKRGTTRTTNCIFNLGKGSSGKNTLVNSSGKSHNVGFLFKNNNKVYLVYLMLMYRVQHQK